MPNSTKGLASLSPERRRELGRMGGEANTKRHRFTSEEARAAGRKGGKLRKTRLGDL